MTYLYAAIAALVLAVCTGLYGAHVGHKAGAAEVQVLWDADKAAITAEATRAQAANTAQLLAAQARNEELTNANSTLQASLAGSAAAGADLAARLRRALSAPAGSCPVPQGADQPAAAATPGVSTGDSGIESAVAAVIGSCERDAARLSALQAEITPQM